MVSFDKIISKYSSAIDTNSLSVNLFNELQNIKRGTYKDIINECRKFYDTSDKSNYSKKKKFLPAVTFSGEFNGSHKKENLKNYSSFIIIDIDALEKESVELIKKELFQDDIVAAIWTSPSGHGLKVLIATTSQPIYHKQCFDSISQYLTNEYNIKIDKSGSDICRLCFVSFDKNLLLKETIIPFNFSATTFMQQTELVRTNINKVKTDIEALPTNISLKKLFHETNGRNNNNNRITIIKIIKFLKKKKLSITGTYHDWFRVACAISNSFTFDLGEKYYLELCRLDNEMHDEYKSLHLLEYCYRNRSLNKVNFATIVFLATEKGFIMKNHS